MSVRTYLMKHAGSTTSRPGTSRRVNTSAVLAVVCVALGAVAAAMASLNVALPDLARSTGATQTQLEWIIDAYSLVFAALLLPAGALGDRYGRRRALLAGLVIFGGASAAAMTATSANELIGLRGVIGLGAALVMPATLSTITGTVPPAQRTRAVSVWAAVAAGPRCWACYAPARCFSGSPGGRRSPSTSCWPRRRSRARCCSCRSPPTGTRRGWTRPERC